MRTKSSHQSEPKHRHADSHETPRRARHHSGYRENRAGPDRQRDFTSSAGREALPFVESLEYHRELLPRSTSGMPEDFGSLSHPYEGWSPPDSEDACCFRRCKNINSHQVDSSGECFAKLSHVSAHRSTVCTPRCSHLDQRWSIGCSYVHFFAASESWEAG